MGRRKKTSNTIIYKGFFHLPRKLLETEDFKSLKGNSIKLLIDIGQQYNGYNNGDLCATLSLMKKRGWNSNQQLTKSLKELLEKNMIVLTKQGGLWIGPSLYAISWQPIHECGGKLDLGPTRTPPRSL